MKTNKTISSENRPRRRSRQPGVGGELRQPIRAIQELTLELAQLRQAERRGQDIDVTEQRLEQLRRRLAAVARRRATDDFGAAT